MAVGKTAVLLLIGLVVTGLAAVAGAQWATHVYGTHAEVALLETNDVQESSGLVASRTSPDIYWTHNDSGGTPHVWALRLKATDIATHLARKMGSVYLPSASNVDWEDIAAGPGPRIYVFDGGDNPPCERTNKRIHRFIEPVIDPEGAPISVSPVFESIRFEYPDSANPSLPADGDDERFDCETLMVHPTTGDIYIVTKRTNANAAAARVYKLAAGSIAWNSPAVHVLQFVADLSGKVPGTTTGGDIDAFGLRLLVRNYSTAYEFTLSGGQPFDDIFAQTPRSISLSGEIQGEGICFSAGGGDIVCTSEVQIVGPQTCPLYIVPWRLANARAVDIGMDRATIMWDTAVPAASAVDYGLTTSYGSTVSDPAQITAHEMPLTSLVPGRRYYYRVASGGLVYPQSAEAAKVFFTTAAGPPGDFDLDEDVDQADYGRLQACLSGSAVSQNDPACEPAKLDDDADVDQADLVAFLGCLSGPGEPADPACAD